MRDDGGWGWGMRDGRWGVRDGDGDEAGVCGFLVGTAMGCDGMGWGKSEER